MRRTILTRSVIAAAALSLGSLALAATPATAAAANGVTRDQVLTAVNGVRAAQTPNGELSIATERALRSIIVKGCDVRTDEDEWTDLDVEPLVTNAGDDADGILIRAYVASSFGPSRTCTIAAFATADASFQLSGAATISADRYNDETDTTSRVTLVNQALSGDAFVTAPIYVINSSSNAANTYNYVAAATGNAAKTTKTTTSTKVADKKSKSEKKAAKKQYDKRIKSAKKSYAKALDKAGNSKSKKSKAKKAYSAKRAVAKTTYRYAVANYKIVKTTTSNTENRPFSITTVVPTPPVG